MQIRLLLDANLLWRSVNLLKQYYDDCSHIDDIGLPIPAKDKEINDLKSEVNNFVEFLLAK